ncbi:MULTISPECIES: hypothetical protein [Streptomyces]|uniref:hypothetical protein n=1 Tax=Streptomyces TaxID=1883 RepID=UPI0004CD2BED|nr:MULTISPECIES: hypothetical protein [Streptomyces]KOT51163.1 hypothetical protein ADK43_32740 [Streptomyces rimosus subsp. rimosus]
MTSSDQNGACRPNADLAARIRTEITERPEHHDQHYWFEGVDTLLPTDDLLDGALECGTTLCVAGYAAHLSGYALAGSKAFKPGQTSSYRYIRFVAQEKLGLDREDADWLFATARTRGEVLAALGQLADGATCLDTDAIMASAN